MKYRACSVVLHSGHIQFPSDKAFNLREFKFKEGKKRRKTLPPSDSINQTYVQCQDSHLFGAVISYDPPQNSNDFPVNTIVEVSVDGRAIDVWTLNSGEQLLLEDGCSPKVLERLMFTARDKENSGLAAGNSFSGTIDFTFWRVMQSDSDQDSDFFPDEGLPALAIFTFHYRSESWLRAQGYIKEDLKQKPYHKAKLDHTDLIDDSKIDDSKIDDSKNLPHLILDGVSGGPEKLGPMTRRRVPVFIYDIHGTLFKKMALNIDKKADISIFYGSFQRILQFLQNDYLQPSNQQIEAVTADGTHHQDLSNLDFDAIEGFYVI